MILNGLKVLTAYIYSCLSKIDQDFVASGGWPGNQSFQAVESLVRYHGSFGALIHQEKIERCFTRKMADIQKNLAGIVEGSYEGGARILAF